MSYVKTTLDLLHIVVECSKQAQFSKKRCIALGSRCTTLHNIVKSHGENIIDQNNAERLNAYLTRASSVVVTLSSRNSLPSMINSCTEELDEIITELDLLIQEMNLQVNVELRDTLRRLELRYKAEKSEDDKEMLILLAENSKRLEDIKDFLSLADIHPFLQRIMEIITEPGQMDINKVINIVKRIERAEDDDPRISNIKDIVREGRANGHDDYTISKDVISIVSGMVQVKNKLEPSDPRIDPKDLVVGKVLGSGSFGTIHEGTWQSKTVAVKVLKDLSAGGNKAFEREVRAINILKDCSNIISLFGYCVDGNLHMIVMELAQNGSLFDFIHYNSAYYDLSDAQKHNLIVGIAHGVAIMHQVGIIHRDLKSPNILLDSMMVPKITDFGLAGMNTKSILSTLSKSATMSIGSVYWKAPEIVMGKKHTNKSDIFSLGIITWEVLQGETPFNGEVDAIVSKLITDGKKMQVSSGIDLVYEKIVDECQKMNPDDRPTALEILQWLRDYANSHKGFAKVELSAAEPNISLQKKSNTSTIFIEEGIDSTIKSQKQPYIPEISARNDTESNLILQRQLYTSKAPAQNNANPFLQSQEQSFNREIPWPAVMTPDLESPRQRNNLEVLPAVVNTGLESQEPKIIYTETPQRSNSANEVGAKYGCMAFFIGFVFFVRVALVISSLVFFILGGNTIATITVSFALLIWLIVVSLSLIHYRGKIKSWVYFIIIIASTNENRHRTIDSDVAFVKRMRFLRFFLVDLYQLAIFIGSYFTWYK